MFWVRLGRIENTPKKLRHSGKWTLNDKKVKLSYQTGGKAVYRGKVNEKYNKMSGTMKDCYDHPGTWSATKKSSKTNYEKENRKAEKVKPSGPGKDDFDRF